MLLGERGGLEHFSVDLNALERVADYVIETIRDNYPDLNVPYHSRWRHFSVGGLDRWERLASTLGKLSRDEIARIRFDLAITSVLLDAGAGPDWTFHDTVSGICYARSEGLALASLAMFAAGLFSSRSATPLRADAGALVNLELPQLTAAFQVHAGNPLAGVEDRCQLLRALGRAAYNNPHAFSANDPRLGNLYHHLIDQAPAGQLAAREILISLLDVFSSIWPNRLEIAGVAPGDVWRHRAIKRDDSTNGLVAFHKLSQWLAYSLIEPLEDSGVTVTGVDALTGLAEYRNGGLFVDLDVLQCRDKSALDQEHRVDDELVVEWRALTVALLDRLAPVVQEKLGVDDKLMPLAKILEGGTWSAGRRIAEARRPGGGPPLRVVSDASVF